MKVDMSPEAVTGRMMMLDQLWELAVAVKNSEIGPRIEPSPDHLIEGQAKKVSHRKQRTTATAGGSGKTWWR